MSLVSQIVKAYDVRGLVDGQLTPPVAAALGTATAELFVSRGARAIVIGRDMRDSGPALSRAFAEGARTRGLRVLDAGLCSTDQLYFASGRLDVPGAMFTASHNPASYNGIKLCGPGAAGISQDTGLAEIARSAQALIDAGAVPAAAPASEADTAPEPVAIAADYASAVRRLGAPEGLGRRLRVVVDAGNGMAGLLAGQVFGGDAGLEPLDLEVIGLYMDLDGSFPNHEANPLDPANLVDLQAAVVEHGADLGLAFDGDADRCFFIDERGVPVTPSAIAALVSKREIARARTAGEDQPVVIHNAITSLAVPEVIRESGGRPLATRVGHSLIKAKMREHGAVFGGEHSAHYYFRDFFCADSGMLAAVHVLSELAARPQTLSQVAAEFERYAPSGEINSTVADQARILAEIRSLAEDGEFGETTISELDGLSVIGAQGDWWFNVRASNTEPLLRLNAETTSPERTQALTARVLELIRHEPAA